MNHLKESFDNASWVYYAPHIKINYQKMEEMEWFFSWLLFQITQDHSKNKLCDHNLSARVS